MAHSNPRRSSGRTLAIATLVALGGAPGLARAGFIGSPASLQFLVRDGDACDVYTTGKAIVAADFVEFPHFMPAGVTFDVDVEDAAVHIANFFEPSVPSDTFSADAAFIGLALTFAPGVTPIESITVAQTALQGVRVTHTDDVVEINWAGVTYSPASSLDLTVSFVSDVPTDDPAAVPTPTAFGGGAATLALAMLRRRRSTKRAG